MTKQITKSLILFFCTLLFLTCSMAQDIPTEMFTEKGSNTEENKLEIEEELVQRIKKGHLIEPAGTSAFDTYKASLIENPSDQSFNKKLKRYLVAALADTADKALTEYFEEGGEFIEKYSLSSNPKPIYKYYLVAADLLGESHYQYSSLTSKAYFVEALKMKYINHDNSQKVKECLEKAIEIDSFSSYAYNELGQYHFDNGNYKMACDNFNLAIKFNPQWEMPKENLEAVKEALTSLEQLNKKG